LSSSDKVNTTFAVSPALRELSEVSGTGVDEFVVISMVTVGANVSTLKVNKLELEFLTGLEPPTNRSLPTLTVVDSVISLKVAV
jgi:hypothetical protein